MVISRTAGSSSTVTTYYVARVVDSYIMPCVPKLAVNSDARGDLLAVNYMSPIVYLQVPSKHASFFASRSVTIRGACMNVVASHAQNVPCQACVQIQTGPARLWLPLFPSKAYMSEDQELVRSNGVG